MAGDLEIGAVVLVGDDAWRRAGWWTRLRAVAFGERQSFEHLGMRVSVSWWRGTPYLYRVREA